jgi:hypothetical protein
MHTHQSSISELLGYTLIKIELVDNEELYFYTDENEVYKMFHLQDCCEGVFIEDIVGDLNDLVGEPLIQAEQVSEEHETEWGTMTWTFYKLSTIKGSVTLRWLGESNGYYSESVDFIKLENNGFIH